MYSLSPVVPLEIGRKPLLIRVNDDDEQGQLPTIMDPFDAAHGFREATLEMEMLRGKQCLGCLQGEWLLMLDEGTSECFMVGLSSLSKISLPPLSTPAEHLSKCAAAAAVLSPGDCTIMFTTDTYDEEEEEDDEEDNYLLYCRPGDKEWREVDDETDGTYYTIAAGCDIVGSQGIMYVRTDMNTFIAVDASSSGGGASVVERRGIPHPSTMRWGHRERLVESDGDVFLVQFYTHGFYNSEVIDVDVHRLDTSDHVWRKAESIGDRAIFVAGNCVALSSATRAGIRPGCVHLLHKHCSDGIRLYTICLDDRTMTCSLLPASSSNIYWVLPSSFNNGRLLGQHLTTAPSSKSSNKIILAFDEDAKQVVAPWSSLPVEMVEELVPKISFIDYFNVREACKSWSLISKPLKYAKRYLRYPMLMSICSSSSGVFKLFDPIVGKEYTMKNSSLLPSKDYFQMLLFAKDGWVMVIRGEKYIYAVNPFTGELFDFPELPKLGNNFDGISFSSAPKSTDCIVCSIYKERVYPAHGDLIYVNLWRAGDKKWTEMKIEDHTQFRTAYSNPIFYHGEFYCLGTRGNLGIFNPYKMTWRVLDKPEPILSGDPMPGEHYCHLLEFRDNLIAIIRPHDKGPIDMYKLDKSRMVWSKVERLDAEVVYIDNWNAIMMPAPRDTCCNKIYIPKLGAYSGAREANHSAFYDLKSRKYFPNYYDLKEQMNSIWVVPNFRVQ